MVKDEVGSDIRRRGIFQIIIFSGTTAIKHVLCFNNWCYVLLNLEMNAKAIVSNSFHTTRNFVSRENQPNLFDINF